MRARVAASHDHNPPPDCYTAPDEPPTLYDDFNIVRVVRIRNFLAFLKLIAMFHITAFAAVAALAVAALAVVALAFAFLLDSVPLRPPLRQRIPDVRLRTLRWVVDRAWNGNDVVVAERLEWLIRVDTNTAWRRRYGSHVL